MTNSLAPNKPDIIQLVKRELANGNLVVLVGGVCSGKSWLINQVFYASAVIDKKKYALTVRSVRDAVRVTESALNSWAAQSENAIAVDELHLLGRDEILNVVSSAVSCKKGALLATQQEQIVIQEIIDVFIFNRKDVLFIEMEFWQSGMTLPVWRLSKRLSRNSDKANSRSGNFFNRYLTKLKAD